MNPVKDLEKHGQAVWLDFIARGFIENGELAKLINEDAVKGVTSNPAIFEKAIGSSDEYDAPIGKVLASGDLAVADLFERVAIEDIQNAADILKPVYDKHEGRDGFVSLEVSPYLANDASGTIQEAEKLWAAVARPNLMVKVPATPAGIEAIRTLTGKGISINVTLLFSQEAYCQVVEAYISGIEQLVAGGGDPSRVASVASFFVSRIDAVADKQLDDKIAGASDEATKARLKGLKGKVAIANAKLAYQHYLRLFTGARWDALVAKGAQPQRLLWASTGTKNKDYRDTLYIEELIGKNTVNTVPPATLDAFRDHGRLRDSLEENVDAARDVLSELGKTGISLDQIAADLVTDGVKLFADAADKLYGAVAQKRATVLGASLNSQALTLGADLEKAFNATSEAFRADGTIRRLWQKDKAVWSGNDENKWLGWLTSVSTAKAALADYTAFADWVKQQGFADAVVLGMGGSSLGPEVFALTFKRSPGFPLLHILDSTDPSQVAALEARVDLAKTLFIVSSKSGGTTEPNVLMMYFHDRVAKAAGADKASSQFVAVTDPGSSLEKTASGLKFAHIFKGDPAIGGRYSVLSPFGFVPAAAAGIDVEKIIDAAQVMVHACGPDVPPSHNPGVQLGIALGVAAQAGRDKITITASHPVDDFGAWTEQLIAESTGKNGIGLLPVADEPLGGPDVYGNDRMFIDLGLAGQDNAANEAKLDALAKAGHPVVRIRMQSAEQIGQEFFRFEIATAVTGAILKINPFNQPDVEASKIKTRELTEQFEASGKLPAETPVATLANCAVYTDAANADALRKNGASDDLTSWLRAQFARVGAGDYVALLGFIARDDESMAAMQHMRMTIRDKLRVATCSEFGPRFLHSTGQAYKGGPDSGVFIQITLDDVDDLAVPNQRASFGTIKAAQARGDFDVLLERGRRALRLHFKGSRSDALKTMNDALQAALT